MPGKERKKYGATDEILALYEKGTFKKGKDFDKQALHQLIDFYKSALPKYEDWRVFNFSFRPTDHYEDISQFYAEIEQQGYKLSRKGINSQVLNRLVAEGKCYLFEITCKDFEKANPNSKDSLQAIYRKHIFAPHSNIKLNGEAEIFFRQKSLDQQEKIITQKNQYTVQNEKAIRS
jgi:CRISPR-associated protein Cpf1